jgi:hypothetical protein
MIFMVVSFVHLRTRYHSSTIEVVRWPNEQGATAGLLTAEAFMLVCEMTA